MFNFDIIVVGAGPSGLTAAIYARRSNKSVLVFESSNPGGKIITTLNIDNYPALPHVSGVDFANNLYNQTYYRRNRSLSCYSSYVKKENCRLGFYGFRFSAYLRCFSL